MNNIENLTEIRMRLRKLKQARKDASPEEQIRLDNQARGLRRQAYFLEAQIKKEKRAAAETASFPAPSPK